MTRDEFKIGTTVHGRPVHRKKQNVGALWGNSRGLTLKAPGPVTSLSLKHFELWHLAEQMLVLDMWKDGSEVQLHLPLQTLQHPITRKERRQGRLLKGGLGVQAEERGQEQKWISSRAVQHQSWNVDAGLSRPPGCLASFSALFLGRALKHKPQTVHFPRNNKGFILLENFLSLF